jgi:inosine-uridine nucleoside N-ribohydrolase
VMGGSIHPKDILKKEGWLKWMPGFLRANIEFNLNADPEAAEMIFAMMPVDRRFVKVYLHDPLTVATVFTRDFVAVEAFHLTTGKRFGVFRTLPQNRLPANALVVTDLDGNVFKRLFAERVFGVTLR